MDSTPASAPTSTKPFPDCLRFQKTWRQYQARILDRLPEYLKDRRVHLVAPPGSGKTIVGIEIVRRIGAPTLILTPSITIRDQWIDRLISSFLVGDQSVPGWVSIDPKRPTVLTVTTYQALHALCSLENCGSGDADERDDISGDETGIDGDGFNGSIARQFPEIIGRAGFRTLVVDEAHHLRSEWWKTLTFVADRLDHPTIVALTGTPPYDVTPFEWRRYEELCGPIDAEISIPELVGAGDLCPHQDYVYLSLPRQEELRVITEFHQNVELFVTRLVADKIFAEAIGSHPRIAAPENNTAALLAEPEYLSSMMIFLNAAGVTVPRRVLHVLGLPRKRIPALNLEWLEILLSHCLYSDFQNFSTHEPLLKSMRRDLLEMGAVERRRITLRSPADHLKLLTTSVTKLASITEIIKLEAKAQQGCLRAVVLTDFIRKSALPTDADEVCSFEDLGVVPIFETLRRAGIPNAHIGVLSGSIVLIPETAVTSIQDAAHKMQIRPNDLLLLAAPHDPEYRVVSLKGEYYQGVVRLITSIFQSGALTVLVGTKSLLGEGWDVPCINTLVLANFVGSYMVSNQMRGRSIRVDPEHHDKAANIWHVVCVEPGTFGPGEDYELLERRCSAFAGVSATSPVIESGTNRLGIGSPPFTCEQVEIYNRQTCVRALDRQGLRLQWQAALNAGTVKQMVDGLKAPDETLPRGFLLSNTIAALLVEAVSVFFIILSELVRGLGRIHPKSEQEWLSLLTAFSVIAALVSAPWVCLSFWRWIRHGTPERSVKQIGCAVLESLKYAGEIDARSSDLHVYADLHSRGSVFCWISGGTGREQNTFLEAMRQILRPTQNPRYLLARPRLWRFFREDYFSVPEVLGCKREYAEFFAKRWRRIVGPIQLIFTRTAEGRRLLLRARGHSLASSFQKNSERISCWK